MFAKPRLTNSSLLLVVVVASVTLFGCSKSPTTAKPIAEQAPAPLPSQPAQPAQPPNVRELPPPKLEEVQQAVKRVFKTAVMIAEDRTPSFLVGDFNGDLSQDLAAIVKPAEGRVSELNQEFPSWIAREPLKDVLLPKSKVLTHPVADRPSANPARGQTIRFEHADVLVAIIHGTGVNGWRDPEATQTHLLRDVVGTNMKMLSFKGAVKTYSGIRPFPTIYGDLIQQTLIGQAGFLYFAGGIYGWYDPKNYSPAPAAVHAQMSPMK